MLDKTHPNQFLSILETEEKELFEISNRVDALCSKYNLSDAEITYLLRQRKNIDFIPLVIFSGSISPLGSLVKYLKEEKSLRFSEISIILNRDQRTICSTYNNSKTDKKICKNKNDKIKIPISYFRKREFSILEIIALYLIDKKNYRLTDIAKMLNKKISTISTALYRARLKEDSLNNNRRVK